MRMTGTRSARGGSLTTSSRECLKHHLTGLINQNKERDKPHTLRDSDCAARHQSTNETQNNFEAGPPTPLPVWVDVVDARRGLEGGRVVESSRVVEFECSTRGESTYT